MAEQLSNLPQQQVFLRRQPSLSAVSAQINFRHTNGVYVSIALNMPTELKRSAVCRLNL